MCFGQIHKHFSFNASLIKGLCLGLLFSCQFLLGSFVEERLTPFPQQTQASALRSPSLLSRVRHLHSGLPHFSADSGICTQVSLTSQQTQASALRSPSLQQASVSSLLLSHSSKCSENFSIKWFPCSPRNSENLCRKWQKKLLYLQKFTKEASPSNRKKKQTPDLLNLETDDW